MRRSNFALRVPPTILAEARKAAESEGVALNQLITLALAEKVSAKPRGLRGQPGQPPPRRMRPSKSASAWNLIRMAHPPQFRDQFCVASP